MKSRTAVTTFLLASVLALAGSAPAMAASTPQAPADGTRVTAAVSTDVDDFSFTSYDADYYLSRDADGASQLRTVETLVAQFPDFDQNRGIIRAIPDDYDGVPLQARVESVVDASGADVPFEESRSNGFLEIALGTDAFVQGSQTYTISYTQQNVVRNFADTGSDEFYWDTNGTGFSQPFGQVNARVHIDPELDAALTGNAACYVGTQGQDVGCELVESSDGAGSLFSTQASDLGPGENVTVAIGFAAGTFVVPEPPTPAAWATLLPVILMILTGLTAIAAAVARVRLGRDARGRGVIVPQYSVPKDFNLFVGGDLVGRSATAVAAEFVSLAVRGNLRLADEGKKYSVRFVQADGLDEQEQALLIALFGKFPVPGDVKTLGTTDNALAARLKKVVGTTRAHVNSRGWRARPRWVVPVALLLVMVALGALSLLLFVANLVASPVPSLAGMVILFPAVSGIVIAALCAIPARPLTEAGAEKRDFVKGLKVYLDLAEADRFRMLQSPEGADRVDIGDQRQVVKLYEKLLPWAVLWGVEKQWASELAVRYEATDAPDWFIGSSTFNAVAFSSSLRGFSSSATSAATPVYVSSGSGGGSSSGGSFGGGFSGGGGGGGGGGGR